MKRLIAQIILLCFLSWLMPLGVFIKPSQEKNFCDGQRAICLCSHLLAKQLTKTTGKPIYKAGTGEGQKEHGGSSNFFLLVRIKNQINKQIYPYLQQQSFLYSLRIIRSTEHVPKV